MGAFLCRDNGPFQNRGYCLHILFSMLPQELFNFLQQVWDELTGLFTLRSLYVVTVHIICIVISQESLPSYHKSFSTFCNKYRTNWPRLSRALARLTIVYILWCIWLTWDGVGCSVHLTHLGRGGGVVCIWLTWDGVGDVVCIWLTWDGVGV